MAAGLAFVTDEATDVKNVGPALSLNYIPCEGILFCLSCFSSEGFHVIWCQFTDISDFLACFPLYPKLFVLICFICGMITSLNLIILSICFSCVGFRLLLSLSLLLLLFSSPLYLHLPWLLIWWYLYLRVTTLLAVCRPHYSPGYIGLHPHYIGLHWVSQLWSPLIY